MSASVPINNVGREQSWKRTFAKFEVSQSKWVAEAKIIEMGGFKKPW